jgi:hypothetical protein
VDLQRRAWPERYRYAPFGVGGQEQLSIHLPALYEAFAILDSSLSLLSSSWINNDVYNHLINTSRPPTKEINGVDAQANPVVSFSCRPGQRNQS